MLPLCSCTAVPPEAGSRELVLLFVSRYNRKPSARANFLRCPCYIFSPAGWISRDVRNMSHRFSNMVFHSGLVNPFSFPLSLSYAPFYVCACFVSFCFRGSSCTRFTELDRLRTTRFRMLQDSRSSPRRVSVLTFDSARVEEQRVAPFWCSFFLLATLLPAIKRFKLCTSFASFRNASSLQNSIRFLIVCIVISGGKQKLLDKGRVSRFNKKFQNFKSKSK